MEQRTRILHHTRSKTPVILAPAKSKPRIPTQTSRPVKDREKAPLASLDTEVSNSSRRQVKPRHHNGSRSSSTGRREPGSTRIVSRDFLKSDQISDRSGDDEDPVSPCRSAPLRRHTMGSITRPRTQSQEAREPTSASRTSCPPEASSSHVGNHCPNAVKWNRGGQDIANGPVVKLPSKNHSLVDESSTNSKHWQLGRVSSKRSDHSESPPSTTTPYNVVSQTVFANSNSNQRRASNPPQNKSRPDSILHLQEKAIPTTLSSQLANSDSINLSSPVTSPIYSFSASSQRQSNVHPPSSLNVRPSTLPSPSAVTFPSSSSQHNGLSSPLMASGHSWKTDPRRRPFQANGEFCLSPGDGSRHTRSPKHTDIHLQRHTFTAASPSATGMESTHVSSSMYSYNSPNSGKSHTLPVLYSRSDSMPDKNLYRTNHSDQQQRNNSHYHLSTSFVNSQSATMPGSPPYRDANQSLSIGRNNDSRCDSSTETIRSPLSSSSDKSLDSSIPCHLDNGSYTTFDIRPQNSDRSPPPRQKSSSSHYDETSLNIQTTSNYNLTFPRYDHKNKTNMQGTNSLNRENGPFSRHTQQYNHMSNSSLGQQSETSSQGRYTENINVHSYMPSGSCRKRDSMRLATEGFGEMSHFSQSIDYADLPGSRNTARYGLPEDNESRSHITMEQGRTVGLPYKDDRHNASSNRLKEVDVLKDVENEELLPNDALPGHFVRGCRQRDSYRLATSSNPDLLSSTDQEEEIFISCEDILSSDKRGVSGESSTPMNKDVLSRSSPIQRLYLYEGEEPVNERTTSPSNTNLKPSSNSEIFSRIKRNSLRLATASLSDLSVILDEIDIGDPPHIPTSNFDTIEHPSPIFMRNCTKLSPLAERSLERSGSSVSSRNSSSFGSFYSCQSIGHTSAKNSPNHASSHSSPRDSKPKVSTPDSIHKLLAANAHDSGISQSSEDTNSYNTFANTSIGSSEEMEYGMNHLPLGGSLNRKRPVFYWTRQSPYPRQNHNTIPASWKPREYSPSKTSMHNSQRHPKSGSIRSYGSTSSVESSSSKARQSKALPRSSQILQRYGCGLDRKSPKLCTRGSTDSLTHKTTHPKHQSPPRGGMSSGNRKNCTLPLPSSHNYHSNNTDFDRYTQPQVPVSPTFVESPTTDTPRSPPSLGRPKRKLYAGFDSQPLPMDTFFSDSSSVCTDVSYSSHGTEASGQPDSGNFDESFYSIDNRSLSDEKDGAFEASLTPKDFMNLTDIHKNSQLRNCRSNSLNSTSTAKEGDAEYSEDEDDAFEETMTPYQNHHPHHHVWPGTNYNQTVTSSLPMTFSI